MTASPTSPPAHSTILRSLKHRWPLLLIVLLGVTMAAIVLSLTVLNLW